MVEFDSERWIARLLASAQRDQLLPGVTDTELRVLAGLASGRTYAAIGESLGYKPKTVKNKGLVLLKKVSPRRRRIDAVSRLVEMARPHLSEAEVRDARQALSDAALSDRELCLLSLLASGQSTSEMAVAVGVTEKSVKNQVYKLVHMS